MEFNHFEVDTARSAAEAEKKLRTGVYQMVITDARMETDDAGFHVLRAARQAPYNPATALLTAYPPMDADWRHTNAGSVLVKPVGTEDLLRQIEALLIAHEDQKRSPHLVSDADALDAKVARVRKAG